jgi:uroporphyrin-III C-methyltransferase
MTVYLVGAGPGDPELLTLKAARLLAAADVVVHDRLAANVLCLAPPTAERIDVGKTPGASVRQAEINQLLVELGASVPTVVRLKGGDPFVFGRGGEEALALQEAGIDWEVVPGVSAAVAAPALAGIPVTHRCVADSFTVVTGHRAEGQGTNWEALAQAGGTIVVLMGVSERGAIAARLIAGGLAPDTPVAVVERASMCVQRVVTTSLVALGDEPIEAPATIVIGNVAGLHLGKALVAK